MVCLKLTQVHKMCQHLEIPPSRSVLEASRSMAVPTSFCSMNNTLKVDDTVDLVSLGHEFLGFECMVVPFFFAYFCLREA